LQTLDSFAAFLRNAPVVVFVDSTGKFSNDTECVNAARKRCRPPDQGRCTVYDFALWCQLEPGQLGVWSVGRRAARVRWCWRFGIRLFSALSLWTVSSDNAGTKPTPLAIGRRDAEAWAAFDPKLSSKHSRYDDMSAYQRFGRYLPSASPSQ
jgi:hypothetical protein